MREGTPAASTKSGATLVELERQLEGALIEYEHLCQAWPEESHVLSWSEAGREMEAALVRIDELQYAIVTSPRRATYSFALSNQCMSNDQTTANPPKIPPTPIPIVRSF